MDTLKIGNRSADVSPRRYANARCNPLEIPIRNFWNSNSTCYDFSRGVIRIPMKYVCRRYTRTQTIRINGRSFPWVFLARLIHSRFTPVNPRKEMHVPTAVRQFPFFRRHVTFLELPLCQPLCESTCFNDRARAILSTGGFCAPRVCVFRRSTSSCYSSI